GLRTTQGWPASPPVPSIISRRRQRSRQGSGWPGRATRRSATAATSTSSAGACTRPASACPRFTRPGRLTKRWTPPGGSATRGFLLVVKANNGIGSVGVRLCADAGAVGAHAAALLGQQHNERGLPVPSCILLEALVAGPEYSAEVFSGSVVGITAKHLGPLPY